MENNRKSKINTGITGFSVLILLLIFILTFQPLITADGGRKKIDIGTMAGYILNNAARVDDDEEEELEEAAEKLADYENLSLISELQIIIQYAKYSSNIYDSYVAHFLAYFIFVALAFIMEILLVVVVFCQLVRTIFDLVKKDCEITDVCKRMSTILAIWILSVMAGISFCEYCDIWEYRMETEFGFAFSVIGILAIIMCIVCMFAHIIIDKASGKQFQSRLIAAALFFTAVTGIYCLKVNAFKIEYSVEVENDNYIDNDDKVSLASLPKWEIFQTIESIQTINNKLEAEKASDYISKIAGSVFILLGAFGCVLLIVVTYSVSMGNFASGMCGRKYSLILQIICSILSIAFVILLAVLLGFGTNQIAHTMENVYKSTFDSASCEFEIKYKMGYFIPFIVNIIFIILSIIKKVFDWKLAESYTANIGVDYSDNFYSQNQPYPQNVPYPQNIPSMPYSQEKTAGQETAYTNEEYSQNRNICSNCGAENEPVNRFCSRCGQEM